jgi:H+/Cl- antiporter ClcA
MSFYYQSTIIYFIAFAIYLLIRGQFVESSYTLITRDPIIYLLAFIVVVSLVALFFNLYRNRYIEFSNEGLSEIKEVKLGKDRRYGKSNALKLVRIKIKTRLRPFVVRPSDYENENELLKKFHQLKLEVEKV